jgi:uncharacterized LabA/DUF88 family protein
LEGHYGASRHGAPDDRGAAIDKVARSLNNMAKTAAERLAELQGLFVGITHVYIDFANVNGCCSKLGWSLDFKKLKSLLDSVGTVKSAKVYYGTIVGDHGSEGFVARIRKEGFQVETKPVKMIELPINVSSITTQSTDILRNFIDDTLIKSLKVEAIEYLNQQLAELNKQGIYSLKKRKCNFDVEIGTEMRLDNALGKAETFCLWSGDSDFAHPIWQLLDEGKKVVVVSKGMARELSDLQPDGLIYFDIRKLKDLISR